MSREIKFRAWNGRFMQDNAMLLDSNGQLYETKGIEMKPVDWPKLFWTGLKDKNGVEIYEGDCVFGVLDGIGARKLEVKQNPTQGWYPLQGELFKNFRENCVVVGNIWENPDQIKASQLAEGV